MTLALDLGLDIALEQKIPPLVTVEGHNYIERCEALREQDYLFIGGASAAWDAGWYDARDGKTKFWAHWLAPDSGYEGLRAWALHSGAVRVSHDEESELTTIITPRGMAQDLAGVDYALITEVMGHCAVTHLVDIIDCEVEAGVNCFTYDAGTAGRAIKCAYWNNWLRFQGDLFFADEESGYASGRLAFVIENCSPTKHKAVGDCRSDYLTLEEILALEAGNDPAPRMWGDHEVETANDLRKLWLLMATKPNYAEARAAL